MNAARLILADAARAGASFRLDDGKLRLVPAPGAALPDGLVAQAKAHRNEIIEALAAQSSLLRTGARVIPFDPARLQREADRRNREAERAMVTDRWCACGRPATLAWPDPDGRSIWRCVECAHGGDA